jgi:hypothetical protein
LEDGLGGSEKWLGGLALFPHVKAVSIPECECWRDWEMELFGLEDGGLEAEDGQVGVDFVKCYC